MQEQVLLSFYLSIFSRLHERNRLYIWCILNAFLRFIWSDCGSTVDLSDCLEKGIDPVRLILVGIGVNSGFGAAIVIFQLKMNPQDFMQVAVWLSGDIWGANWRFVSIIVPLIVLLLPYAIYKSHVLNVLNLGDQIATGLGLKVEKERRILLITAIALAGFSVAAGGGIAF